MHTKLIVNIQVCIPLLYVLGISVGSLGQNDDGTFFRITFEPARKMCYVITAETAEAVDQMICWLAIDTYERWIQGR